MDIVEDDDMIPTYKILVIGDAGVGKSALIFRFADDVFRDTYISTIGIDFRIQTVQVDGKPVKLQVWDTAGQERFRTITTSYYRNADGILIIYAVNDRESFSNISAWLVEIERNSPKDIVKVLVGSKADMPRTVSTEEGKLKAESSGASHIETSSKTGENVKELFTMLGESIVKAKGYNTPQQDPYDPAPRLDDQKKTTKKRKCLI